MDMATYVLLYKGGSMPENPDDVNKVMQAWGSWFGSIGGNLVDGGNPFGPARSISNDGSVSDGGPSALSGYSIIKAENLDEATATAKNCPVLLGGATIEVYETFDVMAAQPA